MPRTRLAPFAPFGIALPNLYVSDQLVLSASDRAVLVRALAVIDRIADGVYPDPDDEDRIEWAAAAMHLREAMPD